jgi:hypothetical protein
MGDGSDVGSLLFLRGTADNEHKCADRHPTQNRLRRDE